MSKGQRDIQAPPPRQGDSLIGEEKVTVPLGIYYLKEYRAHTLGYILPRRAQASAHAS